MRAIMGLSPIFWIDYGLLILSRPLIAWNAIAVVINSLCMGAYFRLLRKEAEVKTP
jgi:MtN3 and saliva related transmembrane protein